MSVRSGSPSGLRSAAQDTRTAAARLQLAAWSAGQQQEPVASGWWGPHAQQWTDRTGELVRSLQRAQDALRAVAAAADAYADEVERAQRQLDALDEQTTALRLRTAHEERAWDDTPAAVRGSRPDAGPGLARLAARARAVEDAAEQAGGAFARRVLAAVDQLPDGTSVHSVLTTGYLYGYALPSGIGTVLGGPAQGGGRTLVPTSLRGPLHVFDRRFGPARFVADVDVLFGGSGQDGARGVTDRTAAFVDLVGLFGVYAGAGTTLGAVVVAGPVTVAAVGTAAGAVSALYLIGTTLWDHRPRRPRPRPERPPVLGPRVPVPRVPPLDPHPAGGLLPQTGPVPGSTPVPRTVAAPSRPQRAAAGPRTPVGR